MDDNCVICKRSLGDGTLPVVTLTEKGSQSLNRCSEQRKDSLSIVPGQNVHQECRRTYCNPNKIIQALKKDEVPGTSQSQPNLRSAEQTFSFQNHCLFCGKYIDLAEVKKKSEEVFPVTTIEAKDAVLLTCNERNDSWAHSVQARVLHVHDLTAADAIYHQVCSVNFRTGRQIPKQHSSDENNAKKAKRGRPPKSGHGRPVNEVRTEAFKKVIQHLEENDDEQIAIGDLVEKMDELLAETDSDPYSNKYMKSQLEEHFGDSITITEINGKPNVVTFRTTADAILQEFHSKQTGDPTKEKFHIIQAAAKLIRDDIKSVSTSNDLYPPTSELESEDNCLTFLPLSLRMILDGITGLADKDTVKLASIGQAVMQATRPRVLMAPLQIGLAVQMHHHFASRFLVDTLHKHGYCSSYQEVQKFEKNAAVSQGTAIKNLSTEFVQYSADNVDHNIRTLDGLGTFHGMGMIASITPAIRNDNPIPRNKVLPTETKASGHVPVYYHQVEKTNSIDIKYEHYEPPMVSDPTENLDLLWKTSLLYATPRPAWAGTMQFLLENAHPGKSSFLHLPMIDMSSSDESCVYSTLRYIANHAKTHNVTPILTFDQPLWWKALMITAAEPANSDLHNIILRLGGFHTEMSFLGSIGHLMSGAGLEELFELMYAKNTIEHIRSGKAVARAVRGHFLLDSALNTMLLKEVFCQDHETNVDENLKEVKSLYEETMAKSRSVDDAMEESVFTQIKEKLQAKKTGLAGNRNASLWQMYMDMVDILRLFIKAERTGNWNLHLKALSEMLPYLAASGHNLYTKSLRLYLQMMSRLETEHPDVYQRFQDGFHVIRRSDRFWAGLSADLIIEQVLMRAMKTTGGLTRGRGMTEQQRITWLLALPACSEWNQALLELTGVNYNTGEQNKDMTKSRQIRDLKDTDTLLATLTERNPFSTDSELKNIMTGVHAGTQVNVDQAKSIGETILDSMTGNSASSFKFKKSEQAVTLVSKTSIKIRGEALHIDPMLMFQRLIIASKVTDNMESAFRHELCSYPPALFDSPGMLHEPQKHLLADAIWDTCKINSTGPGDNVQHVMDGGALIHRIPWLKGFPTYHEICTLYTDYVTRKYGTAIVVFDGYDSLSTKDMTHTRRAKGKSGATVTFSSEMRLTMTKEVFLSNPANKQRFIEMLSDLLKANGCTIHQAKADADVLIVQKAVQSAIKKTTVLVGSDTDLLVLLCYHADPKAHPIYFQPESKAKPRVWNMHLVRQQLGVDLCQNILFLHAILGCDTTSRIHGIGKGASIKKFRTSPEFSSQAKVFVSSSASKDKVISAGEKALVCLYNGKPEESLNSLRYRRFCDKVATKTTHVQPQSLPPTSAAAKFHSLRVYLQVQEWKGEGDNMPLQEWGWKVSENQVVPIMTDLQAAPDYLLHAVRCNCSTDCSTLRCTCRKLNLDCSAACGNCRGTGCTNASQLSDNEDDDSEI